MRKLIRNLSIVASFSIAPCPSVALTPNAASCLELAASPLDIGRPRTIQGVQIGEIETDLAVPACEAAYDEAKVSGIERVRIAFTLGRAYHAADKIENALKLYEVSAKHGFPLALNNLGDIFYNSEGPHYDLSRSMDYFQRAADHGLLLANRNVAEIIEGGEIGPPDWERVASHWRILSASGDDDASFHLAVNISSGLVEPEDSLELPRLYRLAADAGRIEAALKYSNWLLQNGHSDHEKQQALQYSYKALDIWRSLEASDEGAWPVYAWQAAQYTAQAVEEFGLKPRDHEEFNQLVAMYPPQHLDIVVPIVCGEEVVDVDMHIWDWEFDIPQTESQSEWLKEARSC